MKRALFAAGLLVGLAPHTSAQATHSQSSKQYSFKFTGDALAREEWTQDFFDPIPNVSRYRLEARPRIELGISKVLVGVGGDFNYSEDENTVPPPALLRDNYKSRDARFDLAFLSVKPASWFQIEGGRFEMPFGLTEMIWDKDLRPQGGQMTFETHDKKGNRQFALTALYGQGSHVFKDEKAQMFMGQGQFNASGFSLTGSYIEWHKISEIEPMIRRQNTRVNGLYVFDYKVVDGVLRLSRGGALDTQLVIDYCRNTAVDINNQGFWLAVVLGSTTNAKARIEYVFANIDKDATLAAYNTDDFFWSTGWEGHRADIGFKAGPHGELHGVAQWQRFKDSPRPLEQDHWMKRYRAELRIHF